MLPKSFGKKAHIPINDRLYSSEEILYDVFSFREIFLHIQLTKKKAKQKIHHQKIELHDGEIFLDGKKFAGEDPSIKVIRSADLNICAVNQPKREFILSAAESSTICINTRAFVKGTMSVADQSCQLMIFSNGDAVYFNEQKINEARVNFNVGDRLIIAGIMIEMREKQWKIMNICGEFSLNPQEISEEVYISDYPLDFPYFRRSPRIHLKEPKDKVEIFEPKKLNTEEGNDLLRTIVPPIGMLILSGVISFLSGRNPVMVISMGSVSLLSAGFSISHYFTNKKKIFIRKQRRDEEYQRYLLREKTTLSLLREKQLFALEYLYPSMEKLAKMTREYHPRIYERMTMHEDFLQIRVGTGTIPSSFEVEYQFSESDELGQLAEAQLFSAHKKLTEAPIIVALQNQTLGLAGSYSVLRTAVQTLLFQISVLHSYRDVEFITLVPETDYKENWYSWRWLPHVKIRSLNLRGIVYDAQTKDMILNSFYQLIVKRRQQVREAGRKKIRFSPHYVFSILEESWLSGHSLNEFLAENMSLYGVTVIWGKETLNMLPETTMTLISYQNSESAVLINQNNVYINQMFVPNHLPMKYPIEQAIQRLTNLEHVEAEKNAIPESLGLLEQYRVNKIEELKIAERWLAADPSKSIRSLIGWRGKTENVYWDLHERIHGPHALVGGTTGSGKSEFLTTYLIGLAINFSPEDIGMLIIDWKGGGIANTLNKLPHFMGTVTNLDGIETARALTSIKAELDKRQREFAKYGVNNINSYMHLYKQRHQPKPDINYPNKPLPHLFLVSDEFAELKTNVPEFLDELTSVARIGRSLGMHLILATQKPSGIVNDQIEANSTSKIALKMASTQDSNELLKTPDAAQIIHPGRGYLKVGENEVYELFQSGYAGMPYDPNKTIKETTDERIFKINDLGQIELLYDPGEEVIQEKDNSNLPTQLEALIEKIGDIFERKKLVLPDRPWLPNLYERIETPKVIQTDQRNLKILLGLLDIPSEQRQAVYYYDLEKESHTAIFASPGYGKSTILQTLVMNLARQNTPENVQFYLLDFGNNGLLPLKDLPHTADIVTLEEEEKLQKTLSKISELLAERKHLFKENHVTSLIQYEAKTQTRLPIILNILDSYDGLSLEDRRKDKIDECLLQIVRDGASLGIYLVITANRSGSFRMNLMNNFSAKIVLYLNEENELSMLMGREKLITQAISGRGQVMLDKPTAIQVYLPTHGKNSSEILENLQEEIAEIDQNWSGERPEKIPMVPENLTSRTFDLLVKKKDTATVYLGLNKRTALVEKFPLFKGRSIGLFTVSNKSTRMLFSWFIQQLNHQKNDIILIDALGTLGGEAEKVSVFVGKEKVINWTLELKKSLERMFLDDTMQRIVIINGITELVEKLFLTHEEVITLLSGGNEYLQLWFMDGLAKVGGSYGGLTEVVKENVHQILFNGMLQRQLFVENLSYTQKSSMVPRNILHSLKEDEFEEIVVPVGEEQ